MATDLRVLLKQLIAIREQVDAALMILAERLGVSDDMEEGTDPEGLAARVAAGIRGDKAPMFFGEDDPPESGAKS